MQHKANEPQAMEFMQELHPDEVHNAGGDCNNPKCNYQWTPQDQAQVSQYGSLTCPQCQHTFDYKDEWGDYTKAGFSLRQMGQLGEAVVARIGNIPKVGQIQQLMEDASGSGYNSKIDMIVGNAEPFWGVEIKTNHSEAQQRFKISGSRDNRLNKQKYCMENGLKPGLLGVRLNFYTDQADLFWRPGLTDTWIGNSQMDHLGTYDFSDLNPFPDPNAVPPLPDQSEEPDDDLAFLDPISAKVADFDPNNHPRDQLGKFTVRKGQSEVKVVDKKGKHLHTVKWCKHCGEGYRHPAEHKGRIECPTCGEDPERKLRSASYVLYGKDEADQVAAQLGWTQAGTFDNGHRRYTWMDDKGVQHRIGVGSGKHDKNSAFMDGYFARQRMQTCMNGDCIHMSGTEQQMLPQNVHPERQPLRPGDQVESLQGKMGVIADIHEGLVLVQYEDRTEDLLHQDVAQQQLKAVASTPDWAFAYYKGALEVTEWDHNLHFRTLAEKLLTRFGMSVDDTDWQASFDGWTAGFLYDHGKGELSFDFKHPADPDIQTQAIVAVHSWIDGRNTSKPSDSDE